MKEYLQKVCVVSIVLSVLLNIYSIPIRAAEKSYIEAQLRNILKTYSPEGNYIVTRMEDKTGDKREFGFWTSEGYLESLNAAVHEMFHGYIDLLSPGYNWQSVYIKGNKTINVKQTSVFNSQVIENYIPENYKTDRFYTYISSSADEHMGSKINGIYGLLDEFTAYYHGTKTSVDMYNYYNTLPQTPENWLQYLSDVYGTYVSYVEFKYYMFKYMEYAKVYKPDIYKDIINNNEFIIAYNEVEKSYRNLIKDFLTKEATIIYNMKQKGYYVKKDSKYIYLGSSGRGHFMDEYNLINAEISKSKYIGLIPSIKKGWIKGINGSWYYIDPKTDESKTRWVYIGSKWYYFDNNAIMKIGWNYINNKWYYFDTNGEMKTGWQYINNKWYYFDKDGNMKTGWLLLGGKWYYLDKSGYMKTGWQYIGNRWYYFYNSGAMVTGTIKLGSKYYYFDKSGAWIQ